MQGDFSGKLGLVLKALSLSRGRMASALNVDKSLVGRWATGSVRPSEHNLSRLTEFVATRHPGFTMADWDRELPSLAKLFGVALVEERAPDPSLLPRQFLDQTRQATQQRGSAYEGFWQTTRPSVIMNGAIFHDRGMIRRNADGLLHVRIGGSGLTFEGWVLPAEGNLFTVLYNNIGATPLFLVLRGVSLPRAEQLDGLLLLSALNAERTPTAVPVLLERIGDLAGDVVLDDARCEDLLAQESAVPEGEIAEDIVDYLMRDVGPEAAARGGDLFLMASSRAGYSRGASLSGTLRG